MKHIGSRPQSEGLTTLIKLVMHRQEKLMKWSSLHIYSKSKNYSPTAPLWRVCGNYKYKSACNDIYCYSPVLPHQPAIQGNSTRYIFLCTNKGRKNHISYHHFEVQSPLLSSPCPLVSVACLESPSARLTIPLWLDCGLMGRGQQPQGRFLLRQNEDSLDLTLMRSILSELFFLFMYFFVVFI